MVEVPFEPGLDLIYQEVEITGPRRPLFYRFALDTACSVTTISPFILDQIGYSVRDGLRRTSATSALGREPGYLLRVARFTALGHSLDDLIVHVHDLDEESGIDGLIGLNFLNHFNYDVRSREGRILVSPA